MPTTATPTSTHPSTRARRRLYMANNGMVAEIVTMGYTLIEYVDRNGSGELCSDRCNSANIVHLCSL